MISDEEFIEYLKKGQIPPEPPEGASRLGHGYDVIEHYHHRSEATERGMWAIVDKIWTKQLADHIGSRTCLEVMAGAGWLAKALSDYGVDIVATDNGDWDERHSKMVFVHPVEKIDGLYAVEKYSDRDILIVSWPPCGEMDVCDICEKWTYPKEIIYIGEGDWGCNAPTEFFNRFHCRDDLQFRMLSWSGIHDSVMVGTYRRESK